MPSGAGSSSSSSTASHKAVLALALPLEVTSCRVSWDFDQAGAQGACWHRNAGGDVAALRICERPHGLLKHAHLADVLHVLAVQMEVILGRAGSVVRGITRVKDGAALHVVHVATL